MGTEAQKDREARLRAWWSGLNPAQRASEIRAGHVRVNLPPTPEKRELTANQRKAARRAKR